jgi:hypothetical protein
MPSQVLFGTEGWSHRKPPIYRCPCSSQLKLLGAVSYSLAKAQPSQKSRRWCSSNPFSLASILTCSSLRPNPETTGGGQKGSPLSDSSGGPAVAPLPAGPAPLASLAPAVVVGGSSFSAAVVAWSWGWCHTEWARVMIEARSNLKPSTCISSTQYRRQSTMN